MDAADEAGGFRKLKPDMLRFSLEQPATRKAQCSSTLPV